ncbi:MAG: ribose 5-phosphate isomerase B [Bdellovibrio sp.]|nr:ribose 5-phosphate isomerase B [Bdellovibrio sp.]
MDYILIASDHAGVELKEKIKHSLHEWTWQDLGTKDKTPVDYPDVAKALAQKISKNPEQSGILICGSGNGMAMTANKFKNIRAATAESTQAAKLSKEHNNANILCIGARLLSDEQVLAIVRTWLETTFSNEDRHQKRIKKINKIK